MKVVDNKMSEENKSKTEVSQMKNTKSNVMPIFNMRLAGNLMQNGFPMLMSKKNSKYPGKLVYYFRESPELHVAIEKYLSSR